MRHPAYTYEVDFPSFVTENSLLDELDLKTGKPEWTDDEIAAIRRVLKRLTSVRIFNLSDAEDLVQDTLLTMISKLPGTVLEKGALVWGLGILRKKVGNYYRKAQRYASLNEQDAINRRGMLPASPEMLLSQEELHSIVEGVLSRLPSSERQALELMIAGLNAGEIAKQLHPESYQNVINRLYRGRKKLARELAKYGYVPKATGGIERMKRSRGKKSRTVPERFKEAK